MTRIMTAATALAFLSTLNIVIFDCESANILMVHPVVSRSHELVFVTIGDALASRGHNVTIIRFKGRSRVVSKAIHTVSLELKTRGRVVPYMNDEGEVEPPHHLLWSRYRNIQAVPLDITVPVTVACETLLENDNLARFRPGNGTVQYDLAIVDLLFNECGLAFVHQLGLPVAAYWATIPHAGELFWTSSVLAPSFVPSLLTEFSHRMSLLQRLVNTIYYLGSRAFAWFVMICPTQKVIAQYLPDAPHPTTLIQNISLLLVNSDFVIDFSRPIPPNIINIGCIQCLPAQSLPQELENFMQSSGEDGVILLALGATFSEGGMPVTVLKEMYDAFSRCKQKVIVKLAKNSHSIPAPPNVRIVEWLPQQDILGHAKTRLFITHCGMHGVLEGIYHGVPMVGIPIFADQGDVLVRMQLKGIAFGLDKFEVTADRLYDAIQTVLNDQSYYDNVQHLSNLLKDQPQTAMERAMFWIEYMIRNRGAEHLKSADRFLNIAEYLLLDVIALFLVLIAITLLFLKFLFRRLCNARKAATVKPKFEKNHCHVASKTKLKLK